MSGVPQGSILGPILFNIFINNLDEGVNATILLKFADDTKVGQHITSWCDNAQLQLNLDRLCTWADMWGMRFNIEKCHILHLGHTNPRHIYKMNNVVLETREEEKDLGVLISSSLKVGRQCEKAAQTATGVLAKILKGFCSGTKTSCQTYTKSTLDHIWNKQLQPGHRGSQATVKG